MMIGSSNNTESIFNLWIRLNHKSITVLVATNADTPIPIRGEKSVLTI
jgi:hypothetical protein